MVTNHLHNDKSDLMVIGGIGCPSESVEFVNRTIKHLKHKHNAMGELKWTKLNNNKKAFYKGLQWVRSVLICSIKIFANANALER